MAIFPIDVIRNDGWITNYGSSGDSDIIAALRDEEPTSYIIGFVDPSPQILHLRMEYFGRNITVRARNPGFRLPTACTFELFLGDTHVDTLIIYLAGNDWIASTEATGYWDNIILIPAGTIEIDYIYSDETTPPPTTEPTRRTLTGVGI
jgi:hypothetical protein